MQQPELGKRLTDLRKQKNLTQEELVAKSFVSVRTIQRIEAGEVLPRLSTVKILLEALGESYENFTAKPPEVMETKKTVPVANRNTLLIAVLAGAVYLVTDTILITMNIAWIGSEDHWQPLTNSVYIGLQVLMVAAYILFARGFIALGSIFENSLLKLVSYMLIGATICVAALDIYSLGSETLESLLFPYATAALLFGSLSIVFGVALIRLQDGMGELSRVAGLLEIVVGATLITVVLFFISYVVMVPAVVVEILVLYRGYEYLSRTEMATAEA